MEVGYSTIVDVNREPIVSHTGYPWARRGTAPIALTMVDLKENGSSAHGYSTLPK